MYCLLPSLSRCFLVLLCTLLLLPAARAATPEQVEEAIKRAKASLWARYDEKQGNWRDGDKGKRLGGSTALAVYSLLAAGEDPRDPRIKRAVEWLARTDIDATYVVGIRAQIWYQMPRDNAWRDAASRDFRALLTTLDRKNMKGLYRYTIDSGDYDHSCSQIALLGMWGCAQNAHIEVPNLYWDTVDKRWRAHQNADGGWGYRAKANSTASMTAAGVATLFITQDYLNMGRDPGCNGNLYDEAIERGLAWMSKYYLDRGGIADEDDKLDQPAPEAAPNGKEDKAEKRYLYTLYGVSRIGMASGYKYFGTTDWYQAGANDIVNRQFSQVPDTAFALLFLARGRAPVAMNKLNYAIDLRGDKNVIANWNQRPRDVNNIVKWMGKQLERDLNWQIVNLQVPPEDLLDSQILYISGNQALSFTDQEMDKLRRFVQLGGLILGHADCANPQFANSFKKIGNKLFPSYEFRTLPQDHVIFTRQQFPAKAWKNRPLVLGMSNGARELMLLIPQADPAKFWQTRTEGGRQEMWQLASNIFGYTVDKADLRFKGDTYLVKADPKAQPGAALKVARLEYVGDWDPEPAGWQRLKNVMGNEGLADLTIEPVKLATGKLGNEYAVAHMTGAAAFTLNEAAKKELVDFVNGGGTLVIDALGGSPAFSASAERELLSIFPDAALAPLGAGHPIYERARLDGVLYRSAARPVLGGELRTGRLRGLMQGNRLAVLLSREDLSAGLVGQQVDGVIGYRPDVATSLMSSILTHARQPAVPPAAAGGEAAKPPEAEDAAAEPGGAGRRPARLPGRTTESGGT